MDYLGINEFTKAEELFQSAEKIIRYDFGSVRPNARSSYWIARAETEVYMQRSIFLMRRGKTDEALTLGKLAVEKSKVLLKLLDNVEGEPTLKYYAKGSATFALGNVINHQIGMGQFVSAEWSLRDALKFARDNNFNQNHMINFNNMSSDILNGTGRYEHALPYIVSSQKIHIDQGFPKATFRWMRIRSKELNGTGHTKFYKSHTRIQRALCTNPKTP
jgi:tetratricopeptide (TPR) repeat protein